MRDDIFAAKEEAMAIKARAPLGSTTVAREKAAIETELVNTDKLIECFDQALTALEAKLGPVLSNSMPGEEAYPEGEWLGTSQVYESIKSKNNRLINKLRWIEDINRRVEL